jgi:hypothetical protein
MTTCGGDPLLFYVDFPGFTLLTIFQLLALVHWGDHQDGGAALHDGK